MKNRRLSIWVFSIVLLHSFAAFHCPAETGIEISEAHFLENGDFQFTLNGELNLEWELLRSTDMVEWVPQTEFQLTQNIVQIPAGLLEGSAMAFFQAAVLPVLSPDLVWIEPGTFTMGSPENEQDRSMYEGPQTEVAISQGFWLGKYEVTQGEYEAVTGNNPSSFSGDPSLPVEHVSWDNAVAYCAALTEQERTAGRLPDGYEYDLPTEAQWEYACRAGTTTRFSHGDDLNYAELGNYAWNSGNSSSKTHPVGEKLPNAWGLYDMHGNVFEWCRDWFSNYYPGGSVTDPTGATSGSARVLRGGGWDGGAALCRSANHNRFHPTTTNNYVGFRVALVQVP